MGSAWERGTTGPEASESAWDMDTKNVKVGINETFKSLNDKRSQHVSLGSDVNNVDVLFNSKVY